MAKSRKTQITVTVIFLLLLLVLLYALYCYVRRRSLLGRKSNGYSLESAGGGGGCAEEVETEPEQLIKFSGGGGLTVHDILDAPGQVVGKSSYGTLYRATIGRRSSAVLLRFVRPPSVRRTEEVLPTVRMLGAVSHPNLVPLRALYVGRKGEKLFVHPFYAAGTLSQFLRAGVAEVHRWDIIYKLSCGIARGLNHLHTGYEKPIIHGNLKSNNVMIDVDYQARLSDFGLHLIMNPTAAQEMLEASAAQGYKAPELVKLKEASKETDIYSLGVILLEMLTQKDPINNKFLQSKDLHLPTSLRNLVLEHKVSDVFSYELLNQSISQNSKNEEGLLMLFQLAMACCSPSPTLRPNISHVLRRLEDISRS